MVSCNRQMYELGRVLLMYLTRSLVLESGAFML